MSNNYTLEFPNMKKQLILDTDDSKCAIIVVFQQTNDEDTEQIIQFVGHCLKETERKYETSRFELLQ